MRLGLKLWSTNTDYYLAEAERLYADGVFDFIELYVVPGTLDRLPQWQKVDIPFTLHAPHFMHGINLADKDKAQDNLKAFAEVAEYFQVLNAQFTVVHSGMNGEISETCRQIDMLHKQFPQWYRNENGVVQVLIENKPYVAPMRPEMQCRGATIDEVGQVIAETRCKFCLDVSHAICTANSIGKAPYEYLKGFMALSPDCCHISDGFVDSEIDRHMHIGEGTYDFQTIANIVGDSIPCAIESNKNDKRTLHDFTLDATIIRKRIN